MNDNTIDTRQGMDGQTVTTFQAGRPAQAPADISRVTIGNIQGVTRYTVGEETQQPPEPPAFSMQNGRRPRPGLFGHPRHHPQQCRLPDRQHRPELHRRAAGHGAHLGQGCG